MALYGVDLHSQGKQLVLGMQLQAKRAGPLGIRRIEYHLGTFDRERCGAILLSEAHEALNASGLFPSIPDLQALYKNFQTSDGKFHYVDFVRAMRPTLSTRAGDAVDAAFNLVAEGDAVPVAKIGQCFRPEAAPLYRAGSQTAEEAQSEFKTLFCVHAQLETDEETVSRQAWHEFYQDVRLCLPDDDYLVQQLEASWGIAEKGRKATKSEIDAVILQLRSALTQRSIGLKDEVNMRKFMRQYNTSDRVSPEELYELMLFVGVDASPALAAAIVERIDLDKSGSVDLQLLVTTVCEKDPRWGE
jgi:Ca2+-binding EF-hand superfamily protein